MQQTLVGCAFCDTPPGTETGEAHTWGQDERVTHPICVDCAIQRIPTTEIASPVTTVGSSSTRSQCSRGSGLSLRHLEGPLQLCERCSPSGLTTY